MRIFFLVLLICGSALGEPKAPSRKPVSVSYENLTRCFPELQNQKFTFKIELQSLKDWIDSRFLTLESQLRLRKIYFVNATGQSMRLVHTFNYAAGKKVSSQLALQKIDEKGNFTEMDLAENQRVNPKQEVINALLLYANVKSDEYNYFDTKSNGVASIHRLNFKEIQEIELVDSLKKRSVLCEKKSDLGVICTCTLK